MDITTWLEQHGGIAHTREVAHAGFTRHRLRSAIANGSLCRIRRDWVATPTAPAELRHAAQRRGRLSCLSAAAMLGLWHRADGRTHLVVAPNAARLDPTGLAIHWGAGPMPVGPFALIDPIENVLVQLANCQPFENALVVWDSALNRGLVSEDQLAQLPLRSVAARRLRAACSSLADSGIETIPVSRLSALGITVRQQVLLHGHRVDGLIGDRLVLQIDGFAHHSDAAQRRSDITHDRVLTLLGYTVLRFDYKQILFGWSAVENQIVRAIAQLLHLAR